MSQMPMSAEVRRLHEQLLRLPPAYLSGFRAAASLVATFAYGEGMFQAMKGEPAEEIKDYFSGFQAHVFCGDCGEMTFVAGFDL